MDLPIEMRQLIWSYVLPVLSLAICDHEYARHLRDYALLKVSKSVHREVASLMEFDLTIDTDGKGRLQNQISVLHNRLLSWSDAPPMHAINFLSRLHLTLFTDADLVFEIKLVLNSNNDLTLKPCRQSNMFEDYEPLDTRTSIKLQASLRGLDGRGEPLTPRALYLLQAIVTCRSVWQRLLDENPRHASDHGSDDYQYDYRQCSFYDSNGEYTLDSDGECVI
jgi:hypothetical protein